LAQSSLRDTTEAVNGRNRRGGRERYSEPLAASLSAIVGYSASDINARDVMWRLFLIITFPELLQVAIEIALFAFLGFLLYDKLGAKVQGKEAESRRSIRRIAEYYLASTFLLFLAYFLGYARGNTWLVTLFTSSTLRSLEGGLAFLGMVTMLAPLYPLGKILSTDMPIGDISLPELNQTIFGGFFILVYLFIIYGQTLQTQSLGVTVVEASLLFGIVGIIGLVVLSKETTQRKGAKALFFLISCSPWIVIIALTISYNLGML